MKNDTEKQSTKRVDTKTEEHKETQLQKEDKDINNETTTMDFDTILPLAGEFGLYQFLIFLSMMPFYAYGVFVYFSQIFITEVSPNHWCWIPELENLTVLARRDLAIPSDADARFGYSQCSSFVANWSEVLRTGEKPNATWQISSCQNGWEFNKSEIPYPTISSELGWVCDKKGYQATAQSVFFAGSVLGLIFIGWVADRFGRISAIVVCNLIGCAGGVASVYATDLSGFVISRFFVGMAYDNCMIIPFLLILEYVGPKYRTLISNLSFGTFYFTAAVSLPWLALACGHWKIICLATSLPMALAILTPFVLQESPRWLLTRGRVDKVITNLLSISKLNNKKIPPKAIEQFKNSVSKLDLHKSGNFLDVFRRPVMRKLFLLNCLAHICCDIAFDTSIRTLGIFNLDFFLSFSLVSATELPASLTVVLFLDPIGRRWMMFMLNGMTGIFSLLMAFVGNAYLSLVFGVLLRYCISVSYSATYQWGAEMLPTPVRGSGVSIVHMTAFIFTMLAQYIIYLGIFIVWLPSVMSAIVCFVGALTALLLPETSRKEMPQTFEEAESLYTNQSFTEIPWLPRKRKYAMNGVVNAGYQ